MSDPQAGIFVSGTRHHWFLHYRLDDGADLAAVRSGLAKIREQARDTRVALVIGFGDELASRLLADDVPSGLHAFQPIDGVYSAAAATQEDLFLWLHSGQHDVNFALARASLGALRGQASLMRETPSWVYLDSRDLTGFIDGTANPGPEEAPGVALIPEGEAGAGGSYVLAQRWIHDLDAFEALPIEDQEAIIGRTRADSVAIKDRPETSHITRAELVRDGDEQEIYRRSVSYGDVSESGLYFLAFCRDISVFDDMLARMYGTWVDGVADRLTAYSRAVTGAYYFAPSQDSLDRILA
jgi:putative iron-dependent peroxidase